jgi:hypothetical protein
MDAADGHERHDVAGDDARQGLELQPRAHVKRLDPVLSLLGDSGDSPQRDYGGPHQELDGLAAGSELTNF